MYYTNGNVKKELTLFIQLYIQQYINDDQFFKLLTLFSAFFLHFFDEFQLILIVFLYECTIFKLKNNLLL